MIFLMCSPLTTAPRLLLSTPSPPSLAVQLGRPSAYRVGQVVGLQRGFWRGGLLGAPEQRRPAGRGEKEQQEATFLHFPHHVPQACAGSAPPAPLHGDQRAGPHQLQQSHGGGADRRDHRGAVLQRTFAGEQDPPKKKSKTNKKPLYA